VSSNLSVLLYLVSVVVAAFATWYVTKRQGKRDYSHDLMDVIQALEVNNKLLDATNKDLREELRRVQAHRDQLLAEQAALFKKLLINGNGKDH
jgi:hypothetical protein